MTLLCPRIVAKALFVEEYEQKNVGVGSDYFFLLYINLLLQLFTCEVPSQTQTNHIYYSIMKQMHLKGKKNYC